ncbi:hypothetical protein P389DRAFT_71182 [Cystobasidium minutum MCA 4210]|uniref:uncharacterized protein n=1 Tax=Cystobasidium minutum MCA 4210 TaxID=1397322 RepID=UPI0034CDF801|eukprot:jgi/Rhomi1/71182/CE71181_58
MYTFAFGGVLLVMSTCNTHNGVNWTTYLCFIGCRAHPSYEGPSRSGAGEGFREGKWRSSDSRSKLSPCVKRGLTKLHLRVRA